MCVCCRCEEKFKALDVEDRGWEPRGALWLRLPSFVFLPFSSFSFFLRSTSPGELTSDDLIPVIVPHPKIPPCRCFIETYTSLSGGSKSRAKRFHIGGAMQDLWPYTLRQMRRRPFPCLSCHDDVPQDCCWAGNLRTCLTPIRS